MVVVRASRVGAAPGRRPASRSATRSTVGRPSPARVAAVLLWAAWAVGLVALARAATVGAHRVARRRAARPCSSRRARSRATDGGGAALAADRRASSPPCSRCRRRSRRPPGTRSRTATSCASRCASRSRCSSARSRSRSLLIGAGVSVGPLLLADERYVVGASCSRSSGFAIARVARPLAARAVACGGSCSFPPASSWSTRSRSPTRCSCGARQIAPASSAAPNARSEPDVLDLRLGSLAGTIAIVAARRRSRSPRRRGRHDATLRRRRRSCSSSTVRTDAFVRDGRRPPHRRRLSRRASAQRRCRRRARRRRRSTRRPGRARRAAAASSNTNVSPSSRAGNGAPCARDLREHVARAACARTSTSRSRTRSRSSASRGPTVTVAGRRRDVDDVAALAHRDAGAAPLTDRERVDAVVRADARRPRCRRSRPGAARCGSPRNALAAAARDEAHVHALALRRGAQPERVRALAHLGLRHLADRQAACARARAARACTARTTGPWPDRRRARSRGRRGVSTTRAW